MYFDFGRRSLKISAGEFSRFGEPPVAAAFSGRWRAEIGREWHRALQEKPNDTDAIARFEVPVKTVVTHAKWTFFVEGRIDQWHEKNGTVEIREIKTVTEKLPQPVSFWREKKTAFFTQLALYCIGAIQQPETAHLRVRGTLVLVEPATGVIQEIPLSEKPGRVIFDAAKKLAAFAESRWKSHARLQHLRVRIPFENPRGEWLDAREMLAREMTPTAPDGRTVAFLQAPTGFGKTTLALEFALQKLHDGEVSRVVYLTGKNSGRIQVQYELERLVSAGTVRFFTLHSKDEHAIPGIENDTDVWRERWKISGINPEKIFDTGAATLDGVRRIGAASGVPPWEITRALLPLAEIILCDYNYFFSPKNTGVFSHLPEWNPDEILLIVDEAHNLPERAAAAQTVAINDKIALDALDALVAAGASREWLRHWQAFCGFVKSLEKSDRLNVTAAYLLRDLCAEITRLLEEKPPFHLDLDDAVLNTLFLPWEILEILENDTDEKFHAWSPKPANITLECLDASRETGATLAQFHRAILMSATLAPAVSFCKSCGLDFEKISWLECDAAWRKTAYSAAIDARVDTRFSRREKFFRTSAESVLLLGEMAPAAIFFPSYRYAETVKIYCENLDPGFRVAMQSPGMTPAENATFIEESLISAHALFLVLGGGLAEGIDLLGGRVKTAMIVSPGLPEVTPIQETKMRRFMRKNDTVFADPQSAKQAAFREIYLIPAMRKVQQALGRLVRGPDQHARILLHCRRFSEPDFFDLLAPEYRTGVIFHNTGELKNWLKNSQEI